MATNAITEEKDSGLDAKVLLTTLIAFRRGDFSTRMPNDWTGVHGKIADTLNEIVDMAERTTGDFERVSRVVGKAGKINDRLSVADLHGSWAKLAALAAVPDAQQLTLKEMGAQLARMAR